MDITIQSLQTFTEYVVAPLVVIAYMIKSLSNQHKTMAALSDITSAITDLSTAVDTLIAKASGSISATDADTIVSSIKTVTDKVTAAATP